MRVNVSRCYHKILGTEGTHPRKPEWKKKSSERVEAATKGRSEHETEPVARLQNLQKWNQLPIFTIF